MSDSQQASSSGWEPRNEAAKIFKEKSNGVVGINRPKVKGAMLKFLREGRCTRKGGDKISVAAFVVHFDGYMKRNFDESWEELRGKELEDEKVYQMVKEMYGEHEEFTEMTDEKFAGLIV